MVAVILINLKFLVGARILFDILASILVLPPLACCSARQSVYIHHATRTKLVLSGAKRAINLVPRTHSAPCARHCLSPALHRVVERLDRDKNTLWEPYYSTLLKGENVLETYESAHA